MLISFLGGFFLATGGILLFGLYQLMHANEAGTLTQFALPFAHLIAGAGILGRHEAARRLAFAVCFFYWVVGIFTFNRFISSFDYLPIAPLLIYLPQWLLKINIPLMMAVCFFGLPALLMLLMSAEKAAVKFDPALRAFFSWRAPVLVILAAAFVIAYHSFFFSDLNYLTTPHRFFLIGRIQSEVLNGALSAAAAAFPFLAAFSFMSGAKWAWAAILFFAGYYWYPFFEKGMPLKRLQDFSFLFYGVGWVLTALVALFHAQFFWRFETWWERRMERAVERAGRTHGLTQVFQKQTGPAPAAALKPSNRKSPRLVSSLFFLVTAGIIGALIYFGRPHFAEIRETFSKTVLKDKPVPEEPLTSPPAGADPLGVSNIRLEGTSPGPGGAYALVSGEILEIGQMIQGYRLEAIEKKRILISKDGAKQWLDDEGNFSNAD